MDGEKERRNLLFVSTAILVFWWLDLPEGVVIERVLGHRKDEVVIDGWKVWSAIGVVLLYQIHRWMGVVSQLSHWKEGLALWHSRVSDDVALLLLKNVRKGPEKNFKIIYEWNDFLHKDHLKSVDYSLLNIETITPHKKMKYFDGLISINPDVALRSDSLSILLPYRFPLAKKMCFMANGFRWLLKPLYFSEFFIPGVSALLAICYVVYKIWMII